MTRICVVSALYHPHFGGLGRQAQLLSEGLQKAGVELFVIARKMEGVSPELFSPDVEVVRIPAPFPRVHILEEISFRNIFVSTIFSLGCLAALVRRRNRYDIVHFHGASIPLFLCLPILGIMGKKTVVKVASSQGTEAGSLTGRYGFAGKLLLRIVAMADAFVAISDEIRRGLLRDGIPAGRIHAIPNFVDFNTFHPPATNAREERKAALGWSGKTVLLYAGRLAPIKGLDHLFEAFREVSRESPDLLLVLLGEGPMRSSLEEKAERDGISGAVRFLGRVGSVSEYMRAADAFVLPSLQEGMPNALLEAMATCLPVVATRTGGIVDVLEDGRNGLLATPGNAAELADRIRTLFTVPGLRETLGTAAGDKVRSFLSLDRCLERYLDLYSALSGKQDLKELDSHFEFGENWERYSALINDVRIREAAAALARLVPDEELRGKSFLDIGCGSGIHSLAAAHMGASRILAVDLDPKSVSTTGKILDRHAGETESSVQRTSVFDLHPEIHGQFDVVYSWGVLHHTGSMMEAVSHASGLVKPGGLFVFALYRKTRLCRFWKWEKRWYSKTSPGNQKLAQSIYVCLFRGNMLLGGKSFRSFLEGYDRNRGMDFFHDVHDWMGGYPYESISPEDVERLMGRLGFDLERRYLMEDSFLLKLGFFGSGNDEYVYRRRP